MQDDIAKRISNYLIYDYIMGDACSYLAFCIITHTEGESGSCIFFGVNLLIS